MLEDIKRLAFGASVALFLLVSGATVTAQDRGLGDVINAQTTQENLRARQTELFEELLDDPDNLDLMFEYSQVSIRVEDYEAAISTLERMLIYRQDLGRVRLELAVAYFRLGSYAASELYFDQVLADAGTPDTVRARIGRYKDEIELRTRRNGFSVLANVGITHATNATLGPIDNNVLFSGDLVPLSAGQEEADTGLRVLVNVSHVYDLQQEDDDIWRTDLSLFDVRYFDTVEGDVFFARARSGPRLSLDEQQFGPKLRPYAEVQYLNSESRGLFAGFGLGAEYTDTLGPFLSAYADTGFRYRNFFRDEFSDEDSFTYYAAGGLAYIPFRDLVLRGTGIFELDSADGEENSNLELGLRVSGEYQYDSGLAWIDRKWTAIAFAEVRGRLFEEPDPIVDPTEKRRDIDYRAGISHVFALQQGFGIQLDVEGLFRDSTIVNFDVQNLNTTLSLQYRM